MAIMEMELKGAGNRSRTIAPATVGHSQPPHTDLQAPLSGLPALEPAVSSFAVTDLFGADGVHTTTASPSVSRGYVVLTTEEEGDGSRGTVDAAAVDQV
jgi:hypothetical protein